MPRRTRIRIAALEDLARQLRFTPARAVLKQLTRIEDLASELDPATGYPEEWVVFRITGYRPTGGRTPSDDGVYEATLIPGEALLADLSALAERLSEETGAMTGSDAAPVLGLDALGERWNVSRRTLERYRRRGLIARRIRTGPGHVRTVFSERAVMQFERAHGPLLGKAWGYSRLSPEERRRLIQRAGGYRARLGWTLNQVAGRLAMRSGRGRETIRQLLLRHDELAIEPIFNRPGVLSVRDQRVMMRAWARGISPAAIGDRFGRSRASVHRVVNQRRLERLRRIDLSGPSEPWFESPDAPERLLTPAAAQIGLDIALPSSAGDTVTCAQAIGPVDAELERARASALIFLRWRAARRLAGLGRKTPGSRVLDEIETDLRWALHLKSALLRAELPLVVRSVEERLRRPLAASRSADADLLAQAVEAACAAITKHDPFKGGRLAAPVSLALARRLAAAEQHPGARARVEWPVPVESWQRRIDPDPRLRGWAMTTPSEEARAASLRMGWAWQGRASEPPMTTIQVAARMGVTPARVSRLMRRALRAARASGGGGAMG